MGKEELDARLKKIEEAVLENQKYITEQCASIKELEENFKIYLESKDTPN